MTKKLILVISSLFLSLIILEAGLRLAGFVILSMQEHKNRIAISKKSAYRIMCLGESTTQNQYPLFLEEILNQRSPGIKFSVVDKGMSSSDTFLILTQLETNLSAYNPDMVVVMMGVNDTGPHMAYKADPVSFLGNFRVYNLLRLIWLRVLTKAKEISFPKPRSIAVRAKEADPSRAYIKSGIFYRDNQHKFPQAEEAFKKAIGLDPKSYRAYIEFGRLYRDEQKFPQAEEMLKKAIDLNPSSDWAYIELNNLYRSQGKFPQAEEMLKKAIDLNPDSDWAYIRLDMLYRDQGKFSEAEATSAKLALQADKRCAMASVLQGKSSAPGLGKDKTTALRIGYYNSETIDNYRKLKSILDKRGIKLACVQYPMRSIEPLKKIFQGNEEGIVFVDNETIFKEAIKKTSHKEYFGDFFAGDFGHCTAKGNQLLAENIANVILKEVFKR